MEHLPTTFIVSKDQGFPKSWRIFICYFHSQEKGFLKIDYFLTSLLGPSREPKTFPTSLGGTTNIGPNHVLLKQYLTLRVRLNPILITYCSNTKTIKEAISFKEPWKSKKWMDGEIWCGEIYFWAGIWANSTLFWMGKHSGLLVGSGNRE